MLATSRMPLRLSSERVLPLEPLSIEDATTLFVELAAARGVILHEDALASVQAICRRLDGLPLAIELVAARLAVLPPAEILRALGRRARARDGGARRPSRAPAHAARRDRLELRAPHCESARAPRRARGLRRRRRARRRARDRRGGPRRSWPTSRHSSDGASFGARPRTARYACRCSRPCGSTRSSA